jgi:excisionase family DNA binding protein
VNVTYQKGGIGMPGKLLTTKQVQERLGVSERTVFNFMERGDLKGFKVGRSWRFEESEVEDYLRRQQEKAREQRESSAA